MLIFRLFCILVVMCMTSGFYSRDEVSKIHNVTEHLSTALKKLGDRTLGISNIENIYKTASKLRHNVFNASKTLTEIANRIGGRLDTAIEILRNSKDFIEHSTGSNHLSNGLQRCCSADTDKRMFERRFSKPVVAETCCLNCHLNYLGNDSFDFYRKNLEASPFITWQYYGDIDGRYFQYPADASKMCKGNNSLDNRFQDWYVHTASPQKKNVVIVIDASGSMSVQIGFPSNLNSPSRAEIAKEAASTVLDTLSSADFVGVVAFNESAYSSRCQHQDIMVRAVENNKLAVKDFIQAIDSSGDTYYKMAFQRAFSFLNTSKKMNPKQFENSLDIILFLTDGTPSDEYADIMAEIRKGQSLMNESVHIFSYGFGREITQARNISDKTFLIQLSDQNNLKLKNKFGTQNQLKWPSAISKGKPVGPPANYSLISDADAHQLKGLMGSYYTQFPMSNQSDATISLPFNDPNIGQLITLGLPTMELVYGEFTGVVAVDVSVELLFYEVEHFKLGRHSYAFLVSVDGTVILHPVLRSAESSKHPTFYPIQQLEPLLPQQAVHNIMKGIPGKEHLMTQVTSDAGGSSKPVQATYYYAPVTGYTGNFTVVLVIFHEDRKKDSVRGTSSDRFPQFVYHRLDYMENITLEDTNICVRDKLMIMPNNATIKFAPSSFRRPEQNIMFERNSSYSNLFYQTYNNSRDFSAHTGVMGPAAKDVLLTHELDEYWMEKKDIIWRYLGTENGLFRVFPGTLVPNTLYDPREDNWYQTAMEIPHKYLFSRMDHTINNDSIVTLSKAFHLSKDSVHGVIAADMSEQYFTAFLFHFMKMLQKSDTGSFILDVKGYIMVHLDKNGHIDDSVARLHISQYLPSLSAWLIQHKHLKIVWCTDLTTGQNRLSYEFSVDKVVVPVTPDPCLNIVLAPLANTNLLVLTYKHPQRCVTNSWKAKVCSCVAECHTCSAHLNSTCQCPCFCRSLAIDKCGNTLDHNHLYRPCEDKTKHWRNFKKQQLNITNSSNITKCQKPCSTLKTAGECRLHSVCEWCHSGHFQDMPVCSEKCIKNRLHVTLRSECMNLTELDDMEEDSLRDQISRQISDALMVYPDARVHRPNITKSGDVSLMVENLAMENVPHTWLDIMYQPWHVNFSLAGEPVTLTLAHTNSPHAQYIITLHLSGINFTHVLESALTLRTFVTNKIEDLVNAACSPEVAATLTNISPEEDRIEFLLRKPSTVTTTDFETEIAKLKAEFHNNPSHDLLNWHVLITSVTTRGSPHLHCQVPCDNVNDEEICNKVGRCHWDHYHGNCSHSAYIPERILATAYFPCMALYASLNDSDFEGFLHNFQVKVRAIDSGLSQKALHSFNFVKSNQVIGVGMNFTIQGTMGDPEVSDTWWRLRQELAWGKRFIIQYNNMQFRSSTVPTSIWQFTHMQIELFVPTLDVEAYLKKNPLNGRRAIVRGVNSIATRYLPPDISARVQNIWPRKNTVPFLISKPAFSKVDLKTEYNRLKHSIGLGQVSLTLSGIDYLVNSTYFVGSFNEICPRNCSDSISSTVCTTIPGCYWSEYETVPSCVEDSLLPERYRITVLVPCANLQNMTTSNIQRALSSLDSIIHSKLGHSLPTKAIHSFDVGQDYEDSLIFTIQATILGPSLKSVVHNLTLWLSEGHLQVPVGRNGTDILARYVAEYDSAEVALQYKKIDFQSLSSSARRTLQSQLVRQIMDNLRNEFSLIRDSVWFYQSYFLFTFKRKSNTVNLQTELKRLKSLSKLGGFSIKLNGTKISPDNIKSQSRLITTCPVTCKNSSNAGTCAAVTGCFYRGDWHSDHCINDTEVTNRYTYQLFLPCNATQKLSRQQQREASIDLRRKVDKLLPSAGRQVVKTVMVTEDEAYVILQASTLYPHLDMYLEKIKAGLDYTKGFSFGPTSDPGMLSPRNPTDFTNVEVELVFGSIDLGVLQSSGKATFEEISKEVRTQLNKVLLGEIAQSCKVLRIHRENVLFEMKKKASSFVNMAAEIRKIQRAVDKGIIILNVHYIRPVLATNITISGSFKELCPESYPVFTSPSPATVIVSSSSYNTTQVIDTPIPSVVSSIIIIYNATEISTKELGHLMPQGQGLHTCYVDIRSCHFCLSYFSWESCQFSRNQLPTSAPTNEKHLPSSNPDEDVIVFGPVQISIIAVSGFFLLALSLWAADYIRQMKEKSKKKQDVPTETPTQGCSIEDTSL